MMMIPRASQLPDGTSVPHALIARREGRAGPATGVGRNACLSLGSAGLADTVCVQPAIPINQQQWSTGLTSKYSVSRMTFGIAGGHKDGNAS